MKAVLIYCLFVLFYILGNIRKKVILQPLTGEYHYEKTPKEDVLIVQYTKNKVKKWRKASSHDKKILKQLRYIK